MMKHLFTPHKEKNIFYVFCGLTILTCMALLIPYLNVQHSLPQGDIGRDLYAFERILHGEKPYKDFWWVYGPLMPYYYALFLKIFGVNVLSVILAKLTLLVINSVLFFFILFRFTSPVLAYLGAIYYLTQQNDFGCTFSHLGGLTMGLMMVLMVVNYFKSFERKYLYWALLSIVILAFIKLNFGFVSLVAVVATVFWIERTRSIKHDVGFYLMALVVVPVSVFLGHLPFVWGLTSTEIRQCLPYLPGDQPYTAAFVGALSTFFKHFCRWIKFNPPNIVFLILTITAVIVYFRNLKYSKIIAADRFKSSQLPMLFIGLIGIFNLHEFICSGIAYRLYWAQPQAILLVFLFLAVLMESIRPSVKRGLMAIVIITCIVQAGIFVSQAYMWRIKKSPTRVIKVEQQYFNHPKGLVYLANNSPEWIKTVMLTSRMLNQYVNADESFFAFPYDPIFYYLADRKSPTRQLIFFEHINISSEQEHSIIADLERHKTNWIVMSSRIFSDEPGLGVLGKSYCPILADYIYKNFHIIHEFGHWNKFPGWVDPYAVRILKRDKEVEK